MDILANLTDLFDGVPAALQVLIVFGVGIVPFLESYFGTFLGTITGLHVGVAAAAAIAGNLVALAIAVLLGRKLARRRERNRAEAPSARQQKVLARVDRWGVPVASILAPSLLAISLTAFIMIAAGLDQRRVIVWQVVAVVLWGALFAALGLGVLSLTA
jgi:hypothetical protein